MSLRMWLSGRLPKRVLSAVVVATLMVAEASTAALAAVPAAGTPSAARPTVRPKVTQATDLVSARVAARAQGIRVEVLSERTEQLTTWVNPDGTLTTDASSAPVRFRDGSGAWKPVDLDLKNVGGDLRPGGMALGLRLSGGGDPGSSFVSVDHGAGRSIAWAWRGSKLPAPTVSGRTATYAAVTPGLDLRVQVRPRGFEQDFLIKDRAAADAVAAAGGSWQIPLRTKGLTARTTTEGGVEFVDGKGKRVSYIPAAAAWDAEIDPRSGEPASPSRVSLTITQSSPGNALLTVTPDARWLADPSRAFPVTVDPSYASMSVSSSFDTWVATNYSTDQSTSTELKAGTYDGGATKARSFLTFPITGFHGYDVTAASLSLYETHSYSCTAKPLYVYWANGASTSTRWSSQPWINSTSSGSATVAKGYSSSCPDGRISVPITALIQQWSDSTSSAGGLALKASETDSYGWKRFSSSNGSYPPVLSISYNRKPNAASAPTLQTPPAVTYNSFLYTSDSTPQFSSKATDPDASTVSLTTQVWTTTSPASGASPTASCATSFVGSGATGSCSVTTALADNTVYYARTAVKDDRGLWNGTWSPWTTFRTSWATPPLPTISCPAPYTNGSWQDSLPTADVSCTVTGAGSGTSAPGYIRYSLDGAAEKQVKITPSTDPNVAKITVAVPRTSGSHAIVARTESAVGIMSPTTTYSFGYGNANLTAPRAAPATTTTGAITVSAAGPPRGSATSVTASVRWRLAGSGSDELVGWNTSSATLTKMKDDATGVSFSGPWDSQTATEDAYVDSDADTAGVQATKLNPRVPVRLDVQVCLTYTGAGTQCTWSDAASRATVTRVPHAFGSNFPTSEAGPGQVALFTGEFTTAVTDVTVPGYAGPLSLGRSHSTYGNGTAAAIPLAQGVFGPGWTASLQGSEAGMAGVTIVDSTHLDGTIDVIGEDGTSMIFAPSDGKRRTGATLTTGAYGAVDDTTDMSGIALTVSGSGAGTTLALTEEDGTTTTFSAATGAPAVAKAGVFTATGVSVPHAGSTTYTYDSAGRATRILAPVPAGMTAADCPAGPASGLAKGCRALEIVYGTTTGGTTVAGQVTQVNLQAFNPDADMKVTACDGTSTTPGVGMRSIPVACYRYDPTNRRLVTVTDPRSGLGTGYEYGSDNQVTRIVPPGQSPFTLVYDGSNPDQRLKLTAVTRPNPASAGGGTANLARIVYGAPLSGPGLPDLTQPSVARWGQSVAPTYGAAVFGQDYTGAMPGAGAPDWSYADLSYTSADGHTINTARFGSGQWLYTRNDYDGRGNSVLSLDADAISSIIAAGGVDDAAAWGTTTMYNAADTGTSPAAGLPAKTDAGSVVTDVYEPARTATLPDGTQGIIRPHTHTDYDQGAPNAGVDPQSGIGYALPTTVTVTADPGAPVASNKPSDPTGPVISRTFTGYGAADGSATSASSGWTLHAATSTTIDMNLSGATDPGDISSATYYDAEGRVVEKRQPMSNGADPGTSRTTYYTVAPNPADAVCGSKPEWAGLACRTAGAAAPSGQSLPDEWSASFNYLLAPTRVVETSGPVVRTTTTTYLPDGRVDGVVQVLANATSSTPRPGVKTDYDPASGAAVGTEEVGNPNGPRTTSVLDEWGRVTSATSSQGDTATTTYDPAGRVVQVGDAKGVTRYTYDGTDAEGQAERRGLVTKVTVTRAGAATTADNLLTYTAAYDTSGSLTKQTLPGGLVQRSSYDENGKQTGLTYNGQVTDYTETVNEDGSTTWTPGTVHEDATWLAWSLDRDASGRVVRDYNGQGSSFDGLQGVTDPTDITAPSSGRGRAADRSFGYDQAGRLVTVADRSAAATGMSLSPDVAATAAAPCTVRSYGFNADGNRTSHSQTTHPDGDCSSTTGTTTTSYTYGYDNADRPLSAAAKNGATPVGSYQYDELGRQTLVPAADAPDPSSGDISLGYYDNDLPRIITQGGTTTTYSLDQADRRTTSVTGPTGAAAGAPGTSTTVRHYTDNGDNPAWTDTTTVDASGAASLVTTRYTETLGGDLGAQISADGSATLTLANPHGDVVTTVTIPAGTAESSPAVTIDGWSDYTEYGSPSVGTESSTVAMIAGAIGYGWLGAKQRSTTVESAGLTLMGVRLYNPTRGLFTSADPVPGGNTTAYVYPQDPVNGYDLSGKCWGWGCEWIARQAHRVKRYIVDSGYRNRVNAKVIGAGYAGIARTFFRARCRYISGLRTCQSGWGLYARGGTTVGNTYWTSNNPEYVTPARIAHEKVHVKQWYRYGLSFPIRYFRAGLNPCRNRFEREAGLVNGGYGRQCGIR